MTRPGIEPRSPGPLANTLTAGPMSRSEWYIYIMIHWWTFRLTFQSLWPWVNILPKEIFLVWHWTVWGGAAHLHRTPAGQYALTYCLFSKPLFNFFRFKCILIIWPGNTTYQTRDPFWRCPWCSCYRRRKWTRRHEFKSRTRLIAFHIALIPLGKVWIQLFSLQLWVNSRTDWFFSLG